MRNCGMWNAEGKMRNGICGTTVIGPHVRPRDRSYYAVYRTPRLNLLRSSVTSSSPKPHGTSEGHVVSSRTSNCLITSWYCCLHALDLASQRLLTFDDCVVNNLTFMLLTRDVKKVGGRVPPVEKVGRRRPPHPRPTTPLTGSLWADSSFSPLAGEWRRWGVCSNTYHQWICSTSVELTGRHSR